MSQEKENDEVGAGCGCLLLVAAIALVVAAAMSLAALVDPFDWYPSFEELWADCEDQPGISRDECASANRFPGFWWHLVANLAYVGVVLGALVAFAASVAGLRRHRVVRLSSAEAYATYERARVQLALSATGVAVLAALPIAVAVL